MTEIPRPRPPNITRAVAADISAALRNGHWLKHDQTRAVHPTGNPRSHTHPTPGAESNPNTYVELIARAPYQRGIIDPTPNHPPLAWELTHATFLTVLLSTEHLTKAATQVTGWYRKGGSLHFAPNPIKDAFHALAEAATVYELPISAIHDLRDAETLTA